MSPWLMVLPVGGLGWWMLGFPPGWGWLVLPMIPSMPVTFGMLLVLATVVIGAYAGLAWVRWPHRSVPRVSQRANLSITTGIGETGCRAPIRCRWYGPGTPP